MTRRMKDSGIKYLGMIPSDWRTLKNKYIFEKSNYKVGKDYDKFQLLSLSTKGVIEKDIRNTGGKLPASFNTYQQVKKNSIILCLFDLDVSAVFSGISNFDGMISSAYDIFFLKKDFFPLYYEYYYKFLGNDRIYLKYSRTLRKTINLDSFNSIRSIVPPYEEQKKIAQKLDSKSKIIADLISRNLESIEELKKYKQSIITEAVTKGLNPNVEKKNSEIEWIGSVPIHWMLSKVSKVTSSYSGGTPSRNVNNYWENGSIPWVSSGEVSKKLIYESNEYITDLGLRNSSAKMMPKNTVIVALNGQGKTKGSSAILKISASTNQSLVGFICNKELLDYRFLNYVFNASYSYNRSYYAGGNKREGIAASDLRGKRIPLPPLEEQIIIVNHLEEINNNIDKLIIDKTNLIEELENYKKSVIYEYVTGKKEA